MQLIVRHPGFYTGKCKTGLDESPDEQDNTAAGTSAVTVDDVTQPVLIIGSGVTQPVLIIVNTLGSGLLLGRSEVLKSLRHYLQAQSQGHHTIDRLDERGVERGSARQSFLKGREKVIVNHTNIGTVSNAMLGKILKDGVDRICAFPSAYMPS